MKAKLTLKHVKIDANGRYRYRRRVPQTLQVSLGNTEFVKVLGRTEREAIAAYGPYHHFVERQIAMGKTSGDTKSPLEIKEDVRTIFQQHNLDQFRSGRTERDEGLAMCFLTEVFDCQSVVLL